MESAGSTEPTEYPGDIAGPALSKVALNRTTGTVYANGYHDGMSGLQTVYCCACGECVPAEIDCGVIGDIEPTTGRAYFTCDTRSSNSSD